MRRVIGVVLTGALGLAPPAHAQQATEHVELVTGAGTIVLELYGDDASVTVANFLRYVDAGYYDGGTLFRVVRPDNDNGSPAIRVVQGGPRPELADAAFPPIPLERTSETGISHRDGTISMARGEPDSATHNFFITIGAQPSLDFRGTRNPDAQGFAAFGRVSAGMDVVRAINARTDVRMDTEDDYVVGQILADPVVIERAVRK